MRAVSSESTTIDKSHNLTASPPPFPNNPIEVTPISLDLCKAFKIFLLFPEVESTTKTSFFFAKPVVSMIGPKNGLIIGVIGYSVYVVGFVLSIIFIYLSNDLEWITTIISALIGGFAGGLLWTAQGRIFSRHSKLYGEVNRLPVTNVTSNFAGLFALIFLGTEMALKLVATVIFLVLPSGAPFIVFFLYTAIAVVSCFSITIHQILPR